LFSFSSSFCLILYSFYYDSNGSSYYYQ